MTDHKYQALITQLAQESSNDSVFLKPCYKPLVDKIQLSATFENEIMIENLNKSMKSFSSQLYSRKARSTLHSRMLVQWQDRIVLPSVK